MSVSTRFDIYLYSGIPPARAPTPRMREPSMTSKHSEPSNDAIGRIYLGEYLVIRMQHDDQIGAALKCQLIAGLLVPAVPTVALVPDSEDLVLARHVDRIIGAAV